MEEWCLFVSRELSWIWPRLLSAQAELAAPSDRSLWCLLVMSWSRATSTANGWFCTGWKYGMLRKFDVTSVRRLCHSEEQCTKSIFSDKLCDLAPVTGSAKFTLMNISLSYASPWYAWWMHVSLLIYRAQQKGRQKYRHWLKLAWEKFVTYQSQLVCARHIHIDRRTSLGPVYVTHNPTTCAVIVRAKSNWSSWIGDQGWNKNPQVDWEIRYQWGWGYII